MKRFDVLILTASFGNGHNSATQALIEKIENLFPDIGVESADLFDITTPKFKTYLSSTYDRLTKTHVPMYNHLYHVRNSKNHAIDELALKLYYRKFEKYLALRTPKVIISVFPTCALFATHYQSKALKPIKTVTVITDVVANWEWVHEGTDMYFVPASVVKQDLIEKGVNKDSVYVTGVPVREAFKAPAGLTQTKKRVLIMASQMGKSSFPKSLIQSFGRSPYVYTLVTGKNKELYDKLNQMVLPQNVGLIGFSHQVSELMKRSDLLITKPGGATIFEAIESNLPMLLRPSSVGQEKFNVDFVIHNGLGDTFENDWEMLIKIDNMLSSPVLEHLVENIRLFKTTKHETEALKALSQLIQGKHPH